MRLLHIIIAVFLLAVFLRPDTQLVNIVLKADMLWSAGAALFLFGVLLGRFSARWPTPKDTGRIAIWGLFVVSLLALVETTTEWRQSLRLANNQTVVLRAAAVEQIDSHIVAQKNGLYHTQAKINGSPAEMLIDTGASLVLLTYETAHAIGVDMAALRFSEPVISAAGDLKVAPVTLDYVQIGKIRLENVTAAVAPQGQSHANLLGASFLSRLDDIAFRNGHAILKKRR